MSGPVLTGIDSTTAGYLLPLNQVADDDDLLAFFQPILAGIGGYADPSLVRPRWQQPDVPNQPLMTLDWCGFGISMDEPDAFNYESHVDSGVGYDLVEYSEVINMLVSCYGPNSQRFARTLRDGFRIEQNRAPMQAANIDTLLCTSPVTLPVLLHDKWLRRVDFTVVMRRYVSIQYAVRTLVEADATVLAADEAGVVFADAVKAGSSE